MGFQHFKATTTGKILFLVPQVVTSNISLPGHFSLWNLIVKLKAKYTFSIELSTGYLINKSLYDGVRISLATRTGGLKGYVQSKMAIAPW